MFQGKSTNSSSLATILDPFIARILVLYGSRVLLSIPPSPDLPSRFTTAFQYHGPCVEKLFTDAMM